MKKGKVLSQMAKHIATDPALRKATDDLAKAFKKLSRDYKKTDADVRPWLRANAFLPPKDFWEFVIWLEEVKGAPIFRTEIKYELFHEFSQWRERKILKIKEHN